MPGIGIVGGARHLVAAAHAPWGWVGAVLAHQHYQTYLNPTSKLYFAREKGGCWLGGTRKLSLHVGQLGWVRVGG